MITLDRSDLEQVIICPTNSLVTYPQKLNLFNSEIKFNLKQILYNHNCLVLVCQILQNTVVIYHPEVSDLKTQIPGKLKECHEKCFVLKTTSCAPFLPSWNCLLQMYQIWTVLDFINVLLNLGRFESQWTLIAVLQIHM